MWFRSDLRISDNTALHHACRSADEGVIAVFALCPGQWSDQG
ncbi:MAG TPA: deoxyribodipyrimidine photo-lyase [Phycisphaerae bacterium]|nr:deoxyribodipyrimidine photo-lyase [Phycisphaerae bacterium]HRY70964.1 deoxyribodipyrimidine photo-lyase [Phycisphaerae bacterium]HSA29175.1 deoxyribodipyrimidine photo-lyase [Phycisphaerae bacterium]